MKGWFKIEGAHEGDRTLTEQLIGLEWLFDRISGKSILDLGCAEGLISKHLVANHGARMSVGLTSVASQVDSGRKQCDGVAVTIRQQDLNKYAAVPELDLQFDCVLMLSILHKLHNPGGFLLRALPAAADIVIVRLPAPVINDARSGFKPYDHRPVMRQWFDLVDEPTGPRGEYCGIWRRRENI